MACIDKTSFEILMIVLWAGVPYHEGNGNI